MKANKKNYMPGGGMLRNQYQQGGAIPMTEKEKRQLQMIKGLDPLRPNFPRLPDQRSIGQVYGKLQTRVNPPQASNVQPSRITTTQQPATAKPSQQALPQRSAAAMKQSVSTQPAQPATAKVSQQALPQRSAAAMRQSVSTPPASAPTVKPVSPVKGASLTSFGEAFAAARKQGAKEFEYKGKKYNTMLKGGTQRSSETIRPMPSKVPTEVGKGYFESPTGKMAYTPGKSTMANVAAAPMRTASSVTASASSEPQIRTTMSSQATPNATAKLREAIAEKEKNKAGKAPMSPVAKAMMNRYMSKYGSK